MFGVVLWSSQAEGKAVIWCEDHGDLAFFNATDEDMHDALFGFGAGDLVQFDLQQERLMRRASNPRLVSEGQFPDLPDSLLATGFPDQARSNPAGPGATRPAFGQTIPFSPRKQDKKRQSLRHLA